MRTKSLLIFLLVILSFVEHQALDYAGSLTISECKACKLNETKNEKQKFFFIFKTRLRMILTRIFRRFSAARKSGEQNCDEEFSTPIDRRIFEFWRKNIFSIRKGKIKKIRFHAKCSNSFLMKQSQKAEEKSRSTFQVRQSMNFFSRISFLL